MRRYLAKKLIFVLILIFLVSPFFVFADSQGEVRTFFVDPLYDFQQREQISATLKRVSQRAYFYIETDWYRNLTEGEKSLINQNLKILAEEFDTKIYPTLTSIYGSEWKPGIDSDSRITVLFHQIRKEAAGYFNNGDEYPRVQNQTSNQREMVYLNSDSLKEVLLAESYLSHEFTHLITFNQKERLQGVQEEVWLNEARAEYAPTLLGYDEEYQGSNLQQRVKQFLSSPSDSLTEWLNQKKDYGVINLFIQYLVDHYGVEI